ncbi:hypothetical protein L218DRAFT_1060053, partial [Marasmius fiardii PR-910]
MSSTGEQGSSNGLSITIQIIRPDEGQASMAGKYILLIKANGEKPRKSKWNSASGAWDVNLPIYVVSNRVRRDRVIGNGELSIKELQMVVQGKAREFRKKIMLSLGLGTTELGLIFHLSVDGTAVSSSATVSISPSAIEGRTSLLPGTSDTRATAHSPSSTPSLYPTHPPTSNKHLDAILPVIAVAEGSEFPWDTVEKTLELVECFAKVHPIAQVTWAVISGAFKIVMAQHERDKEIVTLFEEMRQVYECATKEDTLNQMKEFSTLFDAMIKQSTEC